MAAAVTVIPLRAAIEELVALRDPAGGCAIPGAPGGAGARELVLVPALAIGYGIPAATALAFSLAVQAAALGTSLLVSLAALAWVGPRLGRPAGDAAPAEAAAEAPAASGRRRLNLPG